MQLAFLKKDYVGRERDNWILFKDLNEYKINQDQEYSFLFDKLPSGNSYSLLYKMKLKRHPLEKQSLDILTIQDSQEHSYNFTLEYSNQNGTMITLIHWGNGQILAKYYTENSYDIEFENSTFSRISVQIFERFRRGSQSGPRVVYFWIDYQIFTFFTSDEDYFN